MKISKTLVERGLIFIIGREFFINGISPGLERKVGLYDYLNPTMLHILKTIGAYHLLRKLMKLLITKG